jgi:LysR family transcriptional regulator, low CO2-responsive transcriptional regulator
MNYTIQQLRIFLKVVQMNSITKASEELFMTQPAVSIQLKKFQEQFDIPLTEVIGRRLYVTDFGHEVAEMAERAMNELNGIQFKTREYQGKLTGRLRLSSASTGKYVIPYFLADFIETYPGIDLRLDVTNKNKVVDSLQNNEVDFALVSVKPENMGLEEELLIDNKLYLIGNTPTWQKEKPLIYREQGSATRREMERYFNVHEKQSRKKLELTSNEAVKEAVIAGLGYSILPLIGVKNELVNHQLYILPAKDLPVHTFWRLVWLKDKKLSPVAQAYLEFIKESKEEIIQKHFGWYMNYQ